MVRCSEGARRTQEGLNSWGDFFLIGELTIVPPKSFMKDLIVSSKFGISFGIWSSSSTKLKLVMMMCTP